MLFPQSVPTINEISGAINDITFDEVSDSLTLGDPQEVSPYIEDILRLYRKTEVREREREREL